MESVIAGKNRRNPVTYRHQSYEEKQRVRKENANEDGKMEERIGAVSGVYINCRFFASAGSGKCKVKEGQNGH